MNSQQLKTIIRRELPAILRQDEEMRRFILRLSRQHFADKVETESRFDRLLDELRRDREEQSKKWAEQQAELRRDREEQARKWAEQNKKWEEQRMEQDKKWEEQQAKHEQLLRSIEALAHRHDSTLGAMGARWGLYSEQSFRNALEGILEEFFDVQVLNVVEYDDEGEVFGRPDQIELDVIIKDGVLLLAEIKSSMSRSDMYTFERKVRFYEKKHGRKASRLLVISPMVEPRARAIADKLGVQVYSYARDAAPAFVDLQTAGSGDRFDG